MTRSEFDSRYKLLRCISEGDIRTYSAQELATGQEVMVHLLAGVSPEESADLRSRLQLRQTPNGTTLLQDAEVDGWPVLLTQPLPGFTSLPQWLESEPPAHSAGAPETNTGEFTRLFGVPAATPPRDFASSALPPDTPAPANRPRAVIRIGAAPASPQPLMADQVAWNPPAHSLPGAEPGPILGGPAALAPRANPVRVRGPNDIAELLGSANTQDSETDSSADSVGQPADAGAGEPRSILPLILTLTFLFLVAAGLVVYFAVKGG
jgi:hypothetical protein